MTPGQTTAPLRARYAAERVFSFAPIAGRDAAVLILGSMPGVASLAAGQYYAHPQNAFWRIMAELLHFDPASRYPARVRTLKAARIAVWDVLQSCRRNGSLDAAIEKSSLIPNDFAGFFHAHPRIERVYFNGTTAEACFRRHVADRLGLERIRYTRLPSTSPANAALSFACKLEAWRTVTSSERE